MSNIYTINNEETQDKFYTMSGKESFVDEEGFPRIEETCGEAVLAKAIASKFKNFDKTKVVGSSYVYYVKINPNRELYNPFPVNDSTKSSSNFINKTCKTQWSFKEVNYYIFNKYLMFLKSKDIRWIKSAQREYK